jgi:hypothetical protein
MSFWSQLGCWFIVVVLVSALVAAIFKGSRDD